MNCWESGYLDLFSQVLWGLSDKITRGVSNFMKIFSKKLQFAPLICLFLTSMCMCVFAEEIAPEPNNPSIKLQPGFIMYGTGDFRMGSGLGLGGEGRVNQGLRDARPFTGVGSGPYFPSLKIEELNEGGAPPAGSRDMAGVECGGANTPSRTGTAPVSYLVGDVFGIASRLTKSKCDVAKNAGFTNNRYTPSYCSKMIDCRDTKLSEFKGRLGQEVRDRFNMFTAKDYAKASYGYDGETMEELEKLRIFAEKKYNKKFSGEGFCKNRFEKIESSESCVADVFEKTYLEFQANCSEMSLGCYKTPLLGLKSFPAYYNDLAAKDELNKGSGVVASYLESVSDLSAKNTLESDDAFLTSLIKIVDTSAFRNANPEARLKLLHTALFPSESNKYHTDPIFSLDFNFRGNRDDFDKFKKNPQYENLKKIVTGRNLSKEAFKENFEKYRENRALEILSDKGSCEKAPTLNSLCSDFKKIANNETLGKKTKEEMYDLFWRDRGDDPLKIGALERILGIKFDDPKEYAILMDAQRCEIFNISSSYEVASGSLFSPESTFRQNSRTNYGNLERSSASGSAAITERMREIESETRIAPLEETYSKKGLEATRKFHDSIAIAAGSDRYMKLDTAGSIPATSTSDLATATTSTTINTVGDIAKKTTAVMNQDGSNFSSGYSANGYNPNNFNSFDSLAKARLEAEANIAGASNSRSIASNTNFNGKISENLDGSETQSAKSIYELSKKLEATEARLERLQAEAKATKDAQEKAEAQRKAEQENALIKELRSQITELKNDRAKAATVASTPKAADRGEDYYNRPNSNVTATPALAPAPKASSDPKDWAASPDYDASIGKSAVAIASSGGTGRASNGAILTATNAEAQRSLATNSVVMQLDGMTTEAASVEISKKIIELNGLPFFVEEGNLVKQIVPIVKNGKVELDEFGNPKFEKIISGKAGLGKFASKKEKASRAPAAVVAPISSTGDLKRLEEQKLEEERRRVRYEEMKKMTDGLIPAR